MPLIEISVVILWGTVAVSGQHLQRQIWMSWFWSFMKLKPSSGTRLATLTNIRLKIIAYHQTMSSIYNWEFDCKHLSHLWFRQVSFDHILFLLTMLLTCHWTLCIWSSSGPVSSNVFHTMHIVWQEVKFETGPRLDSTSHSPWFIVSHVV